MRKGKQKRKGAADMIQPLLFRKKLNWLGFALDRSDDKR